MGQGVFQEAPVRDKHKGKAVASHSSPERIVTPFSQRVLDGPLLKHYQNLNIGDYSGTTDSEDHLLKFENAALLQQFTDGVKCRMFLTTFGGAAQRLFKRLPDNSIRRFKDFRKMTTLVALGWAFGLAQPGVVSSMKPCSRDPLWGEEFNFFVDKLPIQISIAIHDWDIVWQSTILGSLVIPIEREGQIGANWFTLDSKTSSVCLHISSFKLPSVFCRTFSNFIIADARRRKSSEICCKPGPLQTIFNLPLDEVLSHSFSCALERSFLYHGRMYVSTWNICFHSNVFSKQMKVVIPFGDIYEMQTSQHACINPAITIILQNGSGGHGVPPLIGPSGRVRYKFASFWNRNHSFRALHHTLKIYRAWVEAEKKDKVKSAQGVRSNSIPIDKKCTSKVHRSIAKANESQAFVNEKILVCSIKDNFPCTAEHYFTLLLSDDSKFFKEFLLARNDADICLGYWHTSDEYEGIVREVTFRSLCHSPLCPPDTAVTERQRAFQSYDNTSLVFETVQKAHDVPFGSYFEIHSRWILNTNIGNSCSIDVNIGINFSRWCILQSRIRSGATNQQKKEVERFLESARAFLLVSKYSIKGMDEESKHPSSAVVG
ncbi:BAG-associated GRAM protein 1-like [Zingiber officinale]|uniref:BAG-associated GRAM protein 1-like n=1 Tax=Zingiber officinale TaxID=94328 RepID=UPI001C4C591A|nr:BAG-associated GRAM protein 1-like [Zingiber officinale]